MASIRALCLIASIAVSGVAFGQEASSHPPVKGSADWNALEKQLWDVDQQWLCSAGATPYHKDYKECIEFRSKFWDPQFFEVSKEGQVQIKSEMIARQRAAHPSPGVGPHPDGFKLMAVYDTVALATDHTFLQGESKDGKTGVDCTVLRIFVKDNGQWRPAGGALVPITK